PPPLVSHTLLVFSPSRSLLFLLPLPPPSTLFPYTTLFRSPTHTGFPPSIGRYPLPFLLPQIQPTLQKQRNYQRWRPLYFPGKQRYFLRSSQRYDQLEQKMLVLLLLQAL